MNTTDLTPFSADPQPEDYKQQAKEFLKAFATRDLQALKRARKFHPRFFKMPEAHINDINFGLADAEWVIALEHGFESWEQFAGHIRALHEKESLAWQFESAADAIVAGDRMMLTLLLQRNPALLRARSTRRHRATLLHYVAANGVENYRQRTPANAVDIADVLLKAGAEVDALAEMYGGRSTTMGLLVSSCHPAKAGLHAPLVHTLLDHGAAVEGVEQDSAPLITALAFHYTAAAEALASRGANLQSIVLAAGLGRTDLVDAFLDNNGQLREGVPLINLPWMQLGKDPQANVSQAFVWAAMHRRTAVVELMLKKGVDPGVTDLRKFTALHWAAYYGYTELVELLLRYNAPLEAENEFGGTVLDQTIWTAVNEDFLPTHLPLIQQLIDAGAKVQELAGWYLRPGLQPPVPENIAELLRRYLPKTAP